MDTRLPDKRRRGTMVDWLRDKTISWKRHRSLLQTNVDTIPFETRHQKWGNHPTFRAVPSPPSDETWWKNKKTRRGGRWMGEIIEVTLGNCPRGVAQPPRGQSSGWFLRPSIGPTRWPIRSFYGVSRNVFLFPLTPKFCSNPSRWRVSFIFMMDHKNHIFHECDWDLTVKLYCFFGKLFHKMWNYFGVC